MIKIAHRGNFKDPNSDKENHPDYIDLAIKNNYDVEVDIRVIDNIIYLGHDRPDYEVQKTWLLERKQNLWLHAKNVQALNFCLDLGLHCFSHDKDDVVLTSLNYLWTYPGKELGKRSIAVMPDMLDKENARQWLESKNIVGVCTDDFSQFGI